MTVTLFHGELGWACGLGIIAAISGAFTGWRGSWLAQRVTFGYPHLVVRRWDRPGARVRLPDGRTGYVRLVCRDRRAGDMVSVRTRDAGAHQRAEWVPAHRLIPSVPLPRKGA